MFLLRAFLMLTLLTFAWGCGGADAGSEGDENDPAASTDEEQMQDETGDIE